MLALRALTAAALLGALLAALFLLDRETFAGLVGVIVALGAREWALLSGMSPRRAGAYAASGVALYATLAWGWWPLEPFGAPMAGVFAVAAAFWAWAVPAWLARGLPRALLPVAGIAVLVPAALAMAALPRRELLLLLGLVWVGDIAAYFVGGAIGRRKLAPVLSPAKTWEGALGAGLAGLAYAIIVAVSIPDLGRRVTGAVWVVYLAGVALLCAIGIVGDLFESALKRRAGVKDSGRLLPGHGGVLDRIDSATAVLPVGALLLAWLETA